MQAQAQAQTARQPVLFIGHGSPENALSDNAFTRAWRELGESLQRPRSILVVSGHWDRPGLRVATQPQLRQIYDFGGFAQELYQVKYAPPGDPATAAEALALLRKSGACSPASKVVADQTWGLDHGAWVVLRHMFPEADIPTFQVSLDSGATPLQSLRAGEALRPLRDKGVLVVCSGSLTHNLGDLDWSRLLVDAGKAAPWAAAFSNAVTRAIDAGRTSAWEALAEWEALPNARRAHPAEDHLLPLMYAVGLSGEAGNDGAYSAKQVVGGFVAGTLSMASWRFT
eukprot:m51a1_g3881 hypothetical protein (284) ;mRNA; r:40623-41650